MLACGIGNEILEHIHKQNRSRKATDSMSSRDGKAQSVLLPSFSFVSGAPNHILQATIPRISLFDTLYEVTKEFRSGRGAYRPPLANSRVLANRIGIREQNVTFWLHESSSPRFPAGRMADRQGARKLASA
jgi:hypothetical protein